MKAAIFTLCNFRFINYGQVLQCYAFQELCRQHGLDVIVVRYRDLNSNENIVDIPRKDEERMLYEKKYKDKYVEPQDREQVYKFYKFMDDNIEATSLNYTIDEVIDEVKNCELLIVGSDQPWNPAWFQRLYLLEFAREDQRCISYATGGISSVEEYNEATIKLIASKLNHFSKVSVREQQSADILGKYTDKDISVVLDPTLMFDSFFWSKICEKSQFKGNYVLCFFIGLVQPHKHLAKEIAKRIGVKRIIYIRFSRSNEQIADNMNFTAATGVGPGEFLTLIKNSAAVCTDSFHGVAFSIIFHKDFYLMNRAYVVDEGTDGLRMISLMNSIGIGNRNVNCKRDIDCVEPIDYIEVEESLQAIRNSSDQYLISAINY